MSIPVEKIQEVIAELKALKKEAEYGCEIATDPFIKGQYFGRRLAYSTLIKKLKVVNEHEAKPKEQIRSQENDH